MSFERLKEIEDMSRTNANNCCHHPGGMFNILILDGVCGAAGCSIADNVIGNSIPLGEFVPGTVVEGFAAERIEMTGIDRRELDSKSNSWFNDFVFDLACSGCKDNNIVISCGFQKWMESSHDMERIYMKKLLQAMNFVIVDLTGVGQFDGSIPQFEFASDRSFMHDLLSWIAVHEKKVLDHQSYVSLVRTLCGNSLPYLGNVFGCLSDEKCDSIVLANGFRHDVPILFDEFCRLSNGMTMDAIERSMFVRKNSAVTAIIGKGV